MKNRYEFSIIGSLFILVAFCQCESSSTSTTNNNNDTIVQAENTAESKSKEQIIADGLTDAAKVITPLIEKGIENKRYKDSLRAVNKESFWVYKIGVPFNDAQLLSEAYEKVKDIENIAVFDNSGEYSLICIGVSKEQLEDDKGAFKAKLIEVGINNNKVEIINLAEKCGKKGHVIYEQSRKLKRVNKYMPCYKCN